MFNLPKIKQKVIKYFFIYLLQVDDKWIWGFVDEPVKVSSIEYRDKQINVDTKVDSYFLKLFQIMTANE